MTATIGAVAALVALSSGAAALVFSFWPGLRPTPPPDKLSASIGKLAVEPGVGFGEYLARVGALSDYRHLRSDVVESVNTPRLLPGSRGAKVKTLQLLLTQQGLYSGAANGVFGPSTVRAVKQFQEQTKVVADGIVWTSDASGTDQGEPNEFYEARGSRVRRSEGRRLPRAPVRTAPSESVRLRH